MELVVPNEPERGQYLELLVHAFGSDREHVPTWMTEAGHDALRVVREGRDVVGGLGRIDMGQAFGGRFVPMVGVAAVAVRPDRRRRGVASGMMAALLRACRREGFPLSALYASNQPLYRKLGYEHAGVHLVGEGRGTDLAPDGSVGEVELVHPGMFPEIDAFYRDVARHQAGALDRGRYAWLRLREDRYGQEAFGVILRGADGGIDGYLFYRQARNPSGFLTVNVTDALARTADGWRRLRAYLADQSTMAERFTLSTAPADPLWAGQPHPRVAMKLHEPFLVRIVDAAAALSARGWGAGRAGTVVLHVQDALLGDQHLRLHVAAGEGRAEPVGADASGVRVHVRGLAPLYTGHLSAREVAALGLLDATAPELDLLDGLFAGPQPWMRDFF